MFRTQWKIWDRMGLHDRRLAGQWWALVISIASVLTLSLIYSLSNRFADMKNVTVWDPSRVFQIDGQPMDRAIPFVPWFLAIYATLIFFFLVPWIAYPRHEHGVRQFKLLIQSQVMLQLFALPFFILLPAEVAMRDQVYKGLSESTGWIASYRLVHLLDTPFNSWPCLHVAQPLLIVLAVRHWVKYRGVVIGLWLWVVLLGISALTTKQHHIWDVLAGALFAALFYQLILKRGFGSVQALQCDE